MASIKLKNDTTGEVKVAITGFSWTTLFFGGLPALFRGDVLMAVLIFAIGFFTAWIGVIFFAFAYNKMYLSSLIKQGYRPFFTSSGKIDDVMTSLGFSAEVTKQKPTFAQTAQPVAQEPQMRCPECRELILVGARKCKHCGSEIRPVL